MSCSGALVRLEKLEPAPGVKGWSHRITRPPPLLRVRGGVAVPQELTENEPNTMSPIMHDSDYASLRSPSVQDMVRNGKVQDATFRVECLPGVPFGVVLCSVCITEGSIVTRLSFGIEVAESEPSGGCDEMAAVVELDTSFEKVRTDAAVLGRNVPTTPGNALGRGIRVRTGV